MLSDWKYFYQEPFDRKFFKNHQQSATDINSLEQYLWICNLFFMYGNIYLNIQKSIQGKVSVGLSILIDFSIKRKTTFFGPDVPSVASFLVFRNGIRFYNWRISVLNRRVCVFKFKIFKRFSPLLHGLCFRALVDQTTVTWKLMIKLLHSELNVASSGVILCAKTNQIFFAEFYDKIAHSRRPNMLAKNTTKLAKVEQKCKRCFYYKL